MYVVYSRTHPTTHKLKENKRCKVEKGKKKKKKGKKERKKGKEKRKGKKEKTLLPIPTKVTKQLTEITVQKPILIPIQQSRLSPCMRLAAQKLLSSHATLSRESK